MLDESLAKLPIFSGMTDAEIGEALSCTNPMLYQAGQKIITQGHTIRNLWFIRKGRCEVRRHTDSGCEFKLAELGPDSQFGEMSFFQAAPASADVVAITEIQLLRLAREDYDQLLASGNPIAHKLALNSLEQLADRLRRTDQWITDLVCKDNYRPTPSEWTSFRELIFRGP
ncbi:MAG: cyclic nucleotide-binding domain-containing protein [Planctomycetales bacterium]|nr:cyclic nucleotide-binding domain-containing protein [Planctomycetales bacterium]